MQDLGTGNYKVLLRELNLKNQINGELFHVHGVEWHISLYSGSYLFAEHAKHISTSEPLHLTVVSTWNTLTEYSHGLFCPQTS